MVDTFEIPRIVYHGTSTKYLLTLHRIDLDVCSKFADFGKGFYTTSNFRQAESFAFRRAKEHNLEEYNLRNANPLYDIQIYKPLILVYNVNIEKLKKFSKYVFNTPDKKWAEFIYNNRLGSKYLISDFHNWDLKFDYVYGHVADAVILPLIRKIKSGIISFEEFYKRIQPYDKVNGNQLSFHTDRAIDCIRLVHSKIGGNACDKSNDEIC